MPRYVVERTFPEGLNIPVNEDGNSICGGVVARNAESGVTWVQSFVSSDRKQTFCIYDAPTPEAIHSVGREKRAADHPDNRGARPRPLFLSLMPTFLSKWFQNSQSKEEQEMKTFRLPMGLALFIPACCWTRIGGRHWQPPGRSCACSQ